MSAIEDVAAPELQDALDGLLNLIGIAHGMSIDDAIKELFAETETLAVFTVKVVIALFWWAAHIAAATGDAKGYADEIAQSMALTAKYQQETWQQWVGVEHPAAMRQVFIRTNRRIQVVKRIIERGAGVNLKPIEREIAALEKWKAKTVAPDLKNWTQFYALWRKTYKPAVLTVVRWKRKPSVFTDWAGPPIVSWLQHNLYEKRYDHAVAMIEETMVKSWERNPGPIYDRVLDWLVAE